MFIVETHASSHIGRVRKGNEDNYLLLNISGGKRWTGAQDDHEFVIESQRFEVDDNGVVMAVFSSPAPLLRRGGHSQGWDEGADSLGAFFSRLLLAVDYVPGFESEVASADPVTRYAAFLGDAIGRYRDSARLRAADPDFWAHLLGDEQRMSTGHPEEWAAGAELRRIASR